MPEGKPKILVVDDVAVTAAALEELLSKEGFEVQIARDGAEAIRIAGVLQVDAVLMDVEMPTMDGLQALRLLRSAQGRRYLPVLMMSVHDDPQKRITALRLGADDFLSKPWDPEELIARLRRSLGIRTRFDDLVGETAELHRQSITDGLTQIFNHRYFEERLREEFRRAQRYDDPLALVLLDLDDFKGVNDRFGHQEGDRVLREVAVSLRKCIRDTDVIARYGGEEFALLLPKTHLAGALTVAERVWKDVGALRSGTHAQLRISASIGISGYPNRSVISADQLFRTADEALYRAKREGRNKICLYQQPALFAAADPQAQPN
ncbi:MAG TPA: diguanylate cyclase [Myxococcaceae bacterium]|nr:diguanylate cyclase [Myxococcaceae bacterium]